MKKILVFILMCILMPVPFVLRADAPSVTRTPDRFNTLVETKDAYEPTGQIRTFDGGQTFNEARDLVTDDADRLYVANTENREIVVFDEQNNHLVTFGSDILVQPEGLAVVNSVIYVADYGSPDDNASGRIHRFRFDSDTHAVTHIDTLARPDSPVLRVNDFVYRPQKIGVDDNGTMYVVSEGSYNGVLMIGNDNRFLGFFAPNRVGGTLMDHVIRFLYGNNEAARVTKKIPPSVTNVHLDGSGYIYTVTQTTIDDGFGDTLKKVNIGGINFFPVDMLAAEDFVSVTSGSVGNIYALTRSGFIYEYDREGTLLFVFAGSAEGMDRPGLFKNASAVTSRSNGDILVLDAATNLIQTLSPTSFANVVHDALNLYNQGKYVESQSLWEEVLRYNALFDLAQKGVGMSYYMQGDYRLAMEQFKISEAEAEYSNAFWEVRNVYLLSNAGTFMVLFVVLFACWQIVIAIDRRNQYGKALAIRTESFFDNAFFRQAKAIMRFVSNPADACYEVKTRHVISVPGALVFALILVVIHTLNMLLTGMLFTDRVLERTVYLEELLKVGIPFVTFVLSNHLVSSLMDGEGTFKAVFINTLGALVPVLIILPVMIILSNVLTLNEAFLYDFLLAAMVLWTTVLLYFNVKETHHYSVGETFLNILLTVVMMVVMILAAVMVVLMIRQVIDFVGDVMKEVIIHA